MIVYTKSRELKNIICACCGHISSIRLLLWGFHSIAYISIFVSMCLSTCLYTCLYVCLSVYLAVIPSGHIKLQISLVWDFTGWTYSNGSRVRRIFWLSLLYTQVSPLPTCCTTDVVSLLSCPSSVDTFCYSSY